LPDVAAQHDTVNEEFWSHIAFASTIFDERRKGEHSSRGTRI
jgi:hypothetical protein